MYPKSCMLLLCLGHFHIPTTLLINAADDGSESTDSKMCDEFEQIYHRHKAEITAGQSTYCRGSSSKINDPDEDEVVIVGSSRSDEPRYFNPVDLIWQYTMCRQLKLPLVNYFRFNQVVKILNSPLRWVEVKPDGNCFYRVLSFWMSGTEEYYYIIRHYVLQIVKTDPRIVGLLGEEKHREHLNRLSENSWATEVEIVASTLFLDTPIYVYAQHKQTWDLFDRNIKSKTPPKKTEKCIYIHHVSENHYNLVADVVSDQDQGPIMLNPESEIVKIREEAIRYFNPVGAAWQHGKCNKWNLACEEPSQYDLSPTILTNRSPKKCVEIQKDKNCFFRALSYCLTGTEKHHQFIRNRVAEEILFNRALKGLYTENEFISFIVLNDWATKIEILASAVLLNTSIFIYSHDRQAWDLYNKNIEDNLVPVNSFTEKSIYLRQKSPNEYDVVQEVETFL